MSSEALELRRAIACLAVEVPGEVWDDVNAKAETVLAALAVAREREQRRLTEGLGRAYRDSDTGERCTIARLCDVYLDRSGALLGRVRAAALVDEPAAATLAEPE